MSAPQTDWTVEPDMDDIPLPPAPATGAAHDDKPLSQGGDAERMVQLYGDRFRWVAEEKTWLAWDGRRWARDQMFAVQWMARETIRALQAKGFDLPAGDERKRLLGWAFRADSAAGIDGMCKLARYLPGVTVRVGTLDTNRDALNCQNGTLDLKTFVLRPHAPAEMLTRLVDVPYDPSATAPTWLKFLADVFQHDHALIEFVQRCVGYTLTGWISEQVVFFLHGAGQNGKSTFVDVLAALLGDYATTVDKETFLASRHNEGRGPEPEMMALLGKRFAHVDETQEGRELDEGRLKAQTGGATYTGRDLYKSSTEFDNTAKVWFDLNTLPVFKSIDYGMERRLVVIPFDRTFTEHEKDKTMPERLKAELPGILAWAVDGCRAWRQRDLAHRPDQVSLATRRYRDDQNHLPAWFEATYRPDAHGMVRSSVIKADYAGFCSQREEVQHPWRTVVRYLREVRKLTPVHTKTGEGWRGISPRSVPEDDDAQPA